MSIMAQRFSDADDVLAAVEQAIAALQTHHDPAVRDATRQLLEGIDAVHRTGLTHLLEAMHKLSGDTMIKRLIADPAIRMLLMSYDLVAVDRRIQAEEALDTVRGHLHDHGVDVEIHDVVGGVVYARLHVTHRNGAPVPPAAKVRADLEAAFQSHLIGFQELELRDREPASSTVVPLSALRAANRPVYEDVMAADALPAGAMQAVDLQGHSILLARVGGDVFAAFNRCGDSPLPLDHGTLDGTEILCPWHGCRYDVRSGRQVNGRERLRVIPVQVDGNRVRVAIGVTAHQE